MPNPAAFLLHTRSAYYDPRSDKHSNALAEAIVIDLLKACPKLAVEAASGAVVYDLNFDLVYGIATWNVDLVLGQPPALTPPPAGAPIGKTPPSTVQIAVEIKGVMTYHRNNVKNRKRDLESHHQHVHAYNPQTIAGGVMVINASPQFRTSTRTSVIKQTKNMPAVIQHCINEAAAISVRGGPTGSGLDAKSLIVIDFDNVNLQSASYMISKPAPRVGDPLHYDSFIQRLCSEWRTRFGP